MTVKIAILGFGAFAVTEKRGQSMAGVLEFARTLQKQTTLATTDVPCRHTNSEMRLGYTHKSSKRRG